MPLCTLHIGLPKSGSTTIQSMIFSNRTRLLRQGIYVPEASTNGFRRADHHMLAWEIIGKTSAGSVQNHWDALKSELARRGNPEHVLITSEYFQEKLRSVSYIEGLRDRFAALGYRLRLIAYVRPQPEYVNSNYAQNVKLLFNTQGILKYVRRSLQIGRYDYARHLLPAFSVDGLDVVCRPFNRETVQRGICMDFLATLGLDEGASGTMKLPTIENASPGPRTLALCLAIARALEHRNIVLADDERSRSSRAIQDFGEHMGWNAQKFSGVSKRNAQLMRWHFTAGNDAFAAAAWQKSWSDVFGEECWTPPPFNVFFRNRATGEDRSEFNNAVKTVWNMLGFDRYDTRPGPAAATGAHRHVAGAS